MKILVIGGGGQLGYKILQKKSKKYDFYATYQTRIPDLKPEKIHHLNVTEKDSVFNLIKKIKPDAVINTSAIHNVDYCEVHKDEVYLVNVKGTEHLTKACRESNSKMIFISTDYVFNGIAGNYSEDDVPNPICYYGTSKLNAEEKVQELIENYLIIRPSVIYSWVPSIQIQSSSGKPLNFAMWLTQKFEKKESVNIVTDQYSTPTLADSLAETILSLCDKNSTGLYHVTGKTRLSRYDFAKELAQKMDYDEGLINPILTSQLKQVARRPIDSSLNVEKIEGELGRKMPDISQALDAFVKHARHKE